MQSNVNVSKAMTITLPKELPPEPVFKERHQESAG